MPIYKNKKLIHVAIPKTGSTSIYHIFKDKLNNNDDLKIIIIGNTPKRLGHLTLKQIPLYHKDIDINNYKIFSIVRNPYDRFYSIYKHMKNLNNRLIYTNIIDVNNLDFNEWLVKIERLGNISNDTYTDYVNSFFISHFEYLQINNKIEDSIQLFKFENLHELEIEYNIILPHLNTSNISQNYISVYNEYSLNYVYNKYINDFIQFNYEKHVLIK